MLCGGFSVWIDLTGRRGANFALFLSAIDDTRKLPFRDAVWPIVARFLNVAFHISWAMLPVALWPTRRPTTSRGRIWLMGIVFVFIGSMWLSGRVGPWSVTHLYNLGLGHQDVRGWDPSSMSLPMAPVWMFRVFTAAAAASAALMLTRLARFAYDACMSRRQMNRLHVGIAVMFAGGVAVSVAAMAAGEGAWRGCAFGIRGLRCPRHIRLFFLGPGALAHP
ncbi:MAG: hypothetical protein HQ485_04855 [Acidobacteria bacterium]|nr:hypothetical protein [Acidobacteriota bacterium]